VQDHQADINPDATTLLVSALAGRKRL
jgi:hypothetical protein